MLQKWRLFIHLFSCGWIVVSDFAASKVFKNAHLFALCSIVKGLFFVIVTASLLYFLIRSKLYILYVSESKLQSALDRLQKANLELCQTQEKLVSQYKELVKNQEKIKELAYFDTLTGLPNRNHFLFMLEKSTKGHNCIWICCKKGC